MPFLYKKIHRFVSCPPLVAQAKGPQNSSVRARMGITAGKQQETRLLGHVVCWGKKEVYTVCFVLGTVPPPTRGSVFMQKRKQNAPPRRGGRRCHNARRAPLVSHRRMVRGTPCKGELKLNSPHAAARANPRAAGTPTVTPCHRAAAPRDSSSTEYPRKHQLPTPPPGRRCPRQCPRYCRH